MKRKGLGSGNSKKPSREGTDKFLDVNRKPWWESCGNRAAVWKQQRMDGTERNWRIQKRADKHGNWPFAVACGNHSCVFPYLSRWPCFLTSEASFKTLGIDLRANSSPVSLYLMTRTTPLPPRPISQPILYVSSMFVL